MSDSAPEIRVETTEESAVVRSVRVEVPSERVDKLFDRTYKAFAKTARIKGFRPGKIPRSVIVRMYGEAAAEEVERELVQHTFADAMDLAEVQPVIEPDIDASKPAEGAVFTYTARVEIKPTIELPTLKGLPGVKPKVEVSDEDVAAELEQIRERMSPLVEVAEDVAAEMGNTLNIDFEGQVDGVPFEGGAGKDMVIELGSGRLVPGFEEQLVGAKAGADVEVNVTFPEEYGEESLKGKDAVFACKVLTIRTKQLPELDDEFAKDLGEDSLEAFKAKIRQNQEQAKQSDADNVLHKSLMDALIERTDFEVPPGLVERQLQQQMQQMQQQFGNQVPQEILQAELARMSEEGRESAERRVREALLLDAVAKAEALEASESEVDARLAEMAEGQGVDLATFREAAQQRGWLASIEGELLDRKALDFLASGASVEETTGT